MGGKKSRLTRTGESLFPLPFLPLVPLLLFLSFLADIPPFRVAFSTV